MAHHRAEFPWPGSGFTGLGDLATGRCGDVIACRTRRLMAPAVAPQALSRVPVGHRLCASPGL